KKRKKSRDMRVLMHTDTAIFILDSAGKIVFMNPFATYLTDFKEDDAFMKPAATVIRLKDHKGLTTMDYLDVIKKEAMAFKVGRAGIIVSKGGRARNVTIRCNGYWNRSRDLVGFMITLKQLFYQSPG
ncbi:MAG: PAS domain-containing protein, partial [Methanoculleaceae archaeon]